MRLDTATIPQELADHIRKIGRLSWGAVGPKSDEEHITDFVDTLRLTREHFSLTDGPQFLHGAYLHGTETVLCHTGISPNSSMHAQIIVGLWNSVHDALPAPPNTRKE